MAQPKEAFDKLLNKFPEGEILSRNLGFTPDCFTGRETHFLTQVPSHDKMQALVRASDKVRPLLNPIGEYNQRLEQLLKDGLSTSDARKELEAKDPALVLARDNQVVIQRRAQLFAERRASTQDKSAVKGFDQAYNRQREPFPLPELTRYTPFSCLHFYSKMRSSNLR